MTSRNSHETSEQSIHILTFIHPHNTSCAICQHPLIHRTSSVLWPKWDKNQSASRIFAFGVTPWVLYAIPCARQHLFFDGEHFPTTTVRPNDTEPIFSLWRRWAQTTVPRQQWAQHLPVSRFLAPHLTFCLLDYDPHALLTHMEIRRSRLDCAGEHCGTECRSALWRSSSCFEHREPCSLFWKQTDTMCILAQGC